MDHNITETISAAEERLRQAMLSSDIKELSIVLSDGLLFTNHLGQVVSKQDDINMHSSGDLKIEDIQLSDQRVVLLDDVAIVTTKAEISGSYQGSQSNGTFRFTRVWSKSLGGNWQVKVGHSCVVA